MSPWDNLQQVARTPTSAPTPSDRPKYGGLGAATQRCIISGLRGEYRPLPPKGGPGKTLPAPCAVPPLAPSEVAYYTVRYFNLAR